MVPTVITARNERSGSGKSATTVPGSNSLSRKAFLLTYGRLLIRFHPTAHQGAGKGIHLHMGRPSQICLCVCVCGCMFFSFCASVHVCVGVCVAQCIHEHAMYVCVCVRECLFTWPLGECVDVHTYHKGVRDNGNTVVPL